MAVPEGSDVVGTLVGSVVVGTLVGSVVVGTLVGSDVVDDGVYFSHTVVNFLNFSVAMSLQSGFLSG